MPRRPRLHTHLFFRRQDTKQEYQLTPLYYEKWITPFMGIAANGHDDRFGKPD